VARAIPVKNPGIVITFLVAVSVTAMTADAAVSVRVSRDETVTPLSAAVSVSSSNCCSNEQASSNNDSEYTDFHAF